MNKLELTEQNLRTRGQIAVVLRERLPEAETDPGKLKELFDIHQKSYSLDDTLYRVEVIGT